MNQNFEENDYGIYVIFTRETIPESEVVDRLLSNTAEAETFEMRPWVSYKVPDMIGGMLSYEFKSYITNIMNR